jgi:hypothetical protein
MKKWTAIRMDCQSDRHTFNSEVLDESGETIAGLLKPQDARLIAATPDLVRACIALVEWYEWGGDAPQMLDEAVDAAKAALDAAGVTEKPNTRQSNDTNTR